MKCTLGKLARKLYYSVIFIFNIPISGSKQSHCSPSGNLFHEDFFNLKNIIYLAFFFVTNYSVFYRQEATVTMFSGHIVVAIFAEEDSPLLGLR